MTSTTGPAITGMSGWTGCPRSSATAIGSTDPRTTDTGSTPARSCSIPYSRALSCGRPWGLSGDLPRRSLMNESMIERNGVVNPRIPLEDTIIYELHVRGYTIDPSSGVRHPGTYAGLTEKIDYLKWLGITAVELLPVDEFDENDCPFVNPLTGERLKNYWGYNPISFGAPKAAYAMNPERSEPWDEFCEHGRRLPPARDRGHPRHRLQPHGRRGRRRARPTTSAAWTTRSITCSTTTAGT